MPQRPIAPNFDQHLKDQARQHASEAPVARYGSVVSYDPAKNTATVALSAKDSDGIDRYLENVPCPVFMGIQLAAPEPGRPCYVVWLSANSESRPVISHYFNHEYQKRDYYRQSDARTGVSQFYLNM